MRQCSICHKEKPETEFFPHSIARKRERIDCKECARGYKKNYHVRLLDQVYAVLGSKCVHCGFSDKRALQIDHVYDDGAAERREKKLGCGTNPRFLRHILAHLDRYQMLCANCNSIKQRVLEAAKRAAKSKAPLSR